MNDLADQLRQRIASGRFRVSDHAQGRLDRQGISLSDILASVPSWSVIETCEGNRMGLSLLVKHELQSMPSS
ncbi:hypothetical protein [uncultured Hoeflea sp.]|uniref:hypothetical protein n=1 Tax=uncultured Hoeflea sp. TaxID=538666 RepID=UPI0030D88FE9|tara:strand:+ start:628 stop:843 length:216 start_codon:yes stop_codon:yes gene_type:complete